MIGGSLKKMDLFRKYEKVLESFTKIVYEIQNSFNVKNYMVSMAEESTRFLKSILTRRLQCERPKVCGIQARNPKNLANTSAFLPKEGMYAMELALKSMRLRYPHCFVCFTYAR